MSIEPKSRTVQLKASKYPYSAVHIYVSDDPDYPTPFHVTFDTDRLSARMIFSLEDLVDLRDALTNAISDRSEILIEHQIARAEAEADANPELRENV